MKSSKKAGSAPRNTTQKKTRKTSIKAKILAPIGLLIIAFIASGFISMISLNNMKKQGEEVSSKHAQSIYHLGQVSTKFESIQRIIYAHAIADTENRQNQLSMEYMSLSKQIDNVFTEFEATLTTDEEKEAYSKLTAKFAEYEESFDNALKFSVNGETQKVVAIANYTLADLGDEISLMITDMMADNRSAMDEAVKKQDAVFDNARRLTMICIIVAVAIGLLTILICIIGILRPIGIVTRKLRSIIDQINAGNGNLTERVNIKSRDEVGQLAAGINMFIETLQGIMQKINENTLNLEQVVGQVSNYVSVANDNSSDTSSVMEELSATMEEISSTVTNINDSTGHVDNNVVNLAIASEDLLTYASEMKNRAQALQNTAIENKQTTDEMISNIISTLKQAIEDSRSVDRVNELTNEILNISSQTNLLALNASIEAARAGDAGRGFAVVADEIRGLADSSREAANNIQTINNMVVMAVKELIESSNTIISYINENILPDYDNFVSSGAQYSDDAVHVNTIVNKFNEMAEELKELVASITESMDGIAIAIDESANGISSAAANTQNLVENMGQITHEMENNSAVASTLKSEIERFKTL